MRFIQAVLLTFIALPAMAQGPKAAPTDLPPMPIDNFKATMDAALSNSMGGLTKLHDTAMDCRDAFQRLSNDFLQSKNDFATDEKIKTELTNDRTSIQADRDALKDKLEAITKQRDSIQSEFASLNNAHTDLNNKLVAISNECLILNGKPCDPEKDKTEKKQPTK